MSNLLLQFGGALPATIDPRTRVKVDARCFGNGTVASIDEAAFARWSSQAGGVEALSDAARSLVMQHASKVFAARVAQLGVHEALDAGFGPALVASANVELAGLGAELRLGTMQAHLGPESVAALQAAASGAAMQHSAGPTGKAGPSSALIGLAVVGVVAAVGVAAFVLRSSRPPVLPATTVVTPAKQAWDGTSPLRCGAQQHLTVEGLNVSLPGVTAIVADGHCHLELVNVALAAEVGIEASGNATVTVTGGKLSGTRLAVRSLGNAHVELEGTAVTGKTERVGNGKIDGP